MENQPKFDNGQEQEDQPKILKVADLLAQYGGDINEAAIAVQKHHGVDVGPAWWEEHVTKVVGSGASAEEMANAFDAAFPSFLEGRE